MSDLPLLSNAFGPSGCEDEVRKKLIELIDDDVDEWRVDHLGNLLARQRATVHADFRVMVAAHMDEVGFMITHADDSGLLHFVKVGGIDDRVLPAKPVVIGPKRIPGVIAIKPVHLTKADERNKPVPADQLVIDVGATGKAEAEKLFSKGDYAAFATECDDLGEMFAGKAFDDRVGCAVLVELIRRGPYPVEFCPAFTTMEEVGLRGARVAGFSVEPAAAFVLEGTVCDDTPRDRDTSPTTEAGKGPALTVRDGSVVSDRRLLRLVTATADDIGIPYQLKQPGVGGTDGGAIHLARTGVPVLPVSVPSRYIHSPVSVLSKSDVKHTVELMTAVLERMTPEALEFGRNQA